MRSVFLSLGENTAHVLVDWSLTCCLELDTALSLAGYAKKPVRERAHVAAFQAANARVIPRGVFLLAYEVEVQ